MTEEIARSAFLGGFLGGGLVQLVLGVWLLRSVLPERLRPLERRIDALEYLLKLRGAR